MDKFGQFIGGLLRSILSDKGILAGIFGFLWFFYGAIADRIFPTVDTALESFPGILNPLAYLIALSNLNLLVLLFPFISFSLVILIHHYWEKWWWFTIILICVLLFDYIVGIVSSKEIHDHMVLQLGEDYENEKKWSLWFGWPDYFAHVCIVILCGFGASFVAGLLYHALQGKVRLSTDTDDLGESINVDSEE